MKLRSFLLALSAYCLLPTADSQAASAFAVAPPVVQLDCHTAPLVACPERVEVAVPSVAIPSVAVLTTPVIVQQQPVVVKKQVVRQRARSLRRWR